MRRLPPKWFLLLLALALSVAAASGAHWSRPSSQRVFLPSQPGLFRDDMDGDGIDDFIIAQGNEVFIASSDYLATGKAYSRVPFAAEGATVQTVLTGALLGRSQPQVLCAFAAFDSIATNVTCALLQTEQFRLQWIVPSQTLPFALNGGSASPSQTSSDAFIADLDGDGVDALLFYSPSQGSFDSFSLRPRHKDNATFEFSPDKREFQFEDATALASGAATVAPLNLKRQQILAGPLLDCACPATSSQPSRCNSPRNFNLSAMPPAKEFALWSVPSRAPNLAAAPARPFALEMNATRGRFPSDDLLLIDNDTGAVQMFASCASGGSAGVLLQRVLHTLASGWMLPGMRVELANVRGADEVLDVVVTRPPPAMPRPRFFQTQWDGSIASLLPLYMELGDLGRIIRRVHRQTTAAELAWMRLHKPRIIQPPYDASLPPSVELVTVRPPSSPATAAAGSNASMASASVEASIMPPSPAAGSFLRTDAVLWNPSVSRLHFCVATFVSTIPADRVSDQSSGSDLAAAGTKLLSIDADDAATQALAEHFSKNPPFAWLGQRTYLFSYTQRSLQRLDDDPDGDMISTRDELGANMDVLAPFGIVLLPPPQANASSRFLGRFEPLSSLGCSPFRPDVLVEVDWMADASKSQKPFPGFEGPAVQDFANHGIALHVQLDDGQGGKEDGEGAGPIARVEDLGSQVNFSWQTHMDPIKELHFTPARRGFFHWSAFISRYASNTVSGQSRSVPGNDFFVSLGAWSMGTGTLPQQQGTWLHELGHNMGLLHGGNDDQAYKPNHLSVMNYAYQVGGIQRDGRPKFMLSDFDCADLSESSLDELVGVRCVVANESRGHSYDTKVAGKWRSINAPLDFNGDGVFEKNVSVELVDNKRLSILSGGPNEWRRMTFRGLDTRRFDFAQALMLSSPASATGAAQDSMQRSFASLIPSRNSTAFDAAEHKATAAELALSDIDGAAASSSRAAGVVGHDGHGAPSAVHSPEAMMLAELTLEEALRLQQLHNPSLFATALQWASDVVFALW